MFELGYSWTTKKGLESPCAQWETRTPKPFPHTPPQDGVSTNFTNWAGRSDSAGVRTQDPLIKSQMLYRLSYRIMFRMNVPVKRERKDRENLRMAKRFSTFFSFFLIIFFTFNSNAIASEGNPDLASTFESGNKAFEEGKYTQAMSDYEKVYASGKFSENMLYRMAFMYENLRQYPEAIYYLKKAGQEFGDKNSEAKVRQLMQKQGSTRFFSGDGWNGYLSFFRTWKWLFYGLFLASILGIGAHYLLPRKKIPLWRSVGIGFVWTIFFSLILLFSHRSLLVPQRAVLMQETSFYQAPAFSSATRLNAFSLGETLEITDRNDIWTEVAAGGRVWWVPYWVIREL